MAHYLQQETGEFQLLGAADFSTSFQSFSAFLSTDTTSTSTSVFPVGASVTLGATGTWLVNGTVTYVDSAGARNVRCAITDGTVIYASATGSVSAASIWSATSLSAVIISTSASIYISASPVTPVTSLLMSANKSGGGMDTNILAVRLVG